MFNITDLISKTVINISNGCILGTVENAVFDKKFKARYICIFDNNTKLYMPCSFIMHFQNAAIMVKDAIYEQNVAENSPLKAAVYMYDGNCLGICEDIILNDNYYIENILCNRDTLIKTENIVSFSASAIIVCFDRQKIKSLRRIKHLNRQKENNEKLITNSSDGNYENILPREILASFNYLIGRKATATIYDNNNVLVKKNGVITAKIIEACRKSGKIITLAKNNKV